MPFIPHTEEDIRAMCAAIGVSTIEQLFDEIPQSLKSDGLAGIPAGMNEMQVTRLMHERARQDRPMLNFIGAGAYEHHIPAAVWQIATRGEFYSAYTPYQAEASQGTLQLLYEYQSMMASLTGLDATNASLYDGASALAEAVLMAVRLHKTARRVLIPAGVNPAYRRVVASIVSNQRIELIDVPYSAADGRISFETLEPLAQSGLCGAGGCAAELLRRARNSGCLDRLGARARRIDDCLRQPDCARAAEIRPANGAATAPTSRSAKASRWACRSRTAVPTSDSWRANRRWCGRCPAASSGARSTSKDGADIP